MSAFDATVTGVGAELLPPPPTWRFVRRLLRRPLAVAAITVIVVIYTMGILATWVAPRGFDDSDLHNRHAGASSEHLLGTDELGRDLFSRIVWAARTTVIVSVFTVVSGSLFLGISLGLLAAYLGGRFDSLVMRAGDVLHSVPTILMLLIMNATLRDRVKDMFRDVEDFTGIGGIVSSGIPGYFLISVTFALFGWVGMARLIRSQVLALRETNYVAAAEASGASVWRIVFRHLLPNVSNIILVTTTIALGAAGAAEIGLTFLGVGVQDAPSFGVLIGDYAGAIQAHPKLVVYPAIVVIVLIFAFNLLGDALTDVLSPRRR